MGFSRLVLLFCISFFATSLSANSSVQDQQIKMMIQMMESMGELDRLAECINLPTNKVKTIIQKSMNKCGLPDMENDDPEHMLCMQNETVSLSGISASKWDACGEEQAPENPLLSQLEALYERIGNREPTAQEEREINRLMNQMQEDGIKEMQRMVNGMVEGSQGSEHSISLPIFPNAQLLIHMPAQGAIEIAEQRFDTLPGASFLTKSSPQEVLSFYQNSLPSFKFHKPALSPQDAVIMKELPNNFDYVRDMGRAFSIPHIYIQPAAQAEQLRLDGAKTMFFIYYKPQ